MYVLLRYNCALYYCIPGVILMCRVKIHKIITSFVRSENVKCSTFVKLRRVMYILTMWHFKQIYDIGN